LKQYIQINVKMYFMLTLGFFITLENKCKIFKLIYVLLV